MKCPICKRDVQEPAKGEPLGTFPFCSDRCKLVDLGRWLGGKYQIPVNDPDEENRETPRADRRVAGGGDGDGED
jgi:endogenous inhibitor of DNA gyrase (YacG/DUF329 family)